MQKTAIIFVGIQASGKSTFYEKQLKPLGFFQISMDLIHSRRREQELLDQCILDGSPLVIDNTNPTREDRQRYLPKLKAAGYCVQCYFFKSRVRDCIRRNEERGEKVPPQAIAATSNKLVLPSRKEGFDEIFFVQIAPEGFDISPYIEQQDDEI